MTDDGGQALRDQLGTKKCRERERERERRTNRVRDAAGGCDHTQHARTEG